MSTNATLLFVLFVIPAYTQEIIGIGLVKIRVDNTPVLDFYRKPTDDTFKHRIHLDRDLDLKGVKIREFAEVSDWLKPELLWLDDFQFVFRCKSARKGWYEVVVTNENGHTLWIRDDNTTKFVEWEEYLRDMELVSRTPYYKQKIRARSDDRSEEIPYTGPDCFQVKSLSKDWIEIFTPPTCPSETLKVTSGWIRWRKGNKFLIDY